MNSQQNAERASTSGIIGTLARRLTMVVVLTLAFFLSAVITIYIMFRSGDTRVPDIIGKSEGEAKSILETGKFEVRIQRRTDEAPANTVIETRPAPNASVKTNSLVIIVVSSGPAQNKSQLHNQQFLVSGLWLAVSGFSSPGFRLPQANKIYPEEVALAYPAEAENDKPETRN
jgi:hypothetical protein